MTDHIYIHESHHNQRKSDKIIQMAQFKSAVVGFLAAKPSFMKLWSFFA